MRIQKQTNRESMRQIWNKYACCRALNCAVFSLFSLSATLKLVPCDEYKTMNFYISMILYRCDSTFQFHKQLKFQNNLLSMEGWRHSQISRNFCCNLGTGNDFNVNFVQAEWWTLSNSKYSEYHNTTLTTRLQMQLMWPMLIRLFRSEFNWISPSPDKFLLFVVPATVNTVRASMWLVLPCQRSLKSSFKINYFWSLSDG